MQTSRLGFLTAGQSSMGHFLKMRTRKSVTIRITGLLVFLLAGLLATNSVHSDEEIGLRLMTFNIRYDTATDGRNAWPNRREAVAGLIRFHRPDILGLQEVQAHQQDWLLSSLPGFLAIGVGRDDGKSGGEFSPLFIKRERFELHDSGTFWLSTTPGEPSKSWDAAFPRIATWARLTDRVSGNDYLAVNTHWDHRGEEARIQSANLVRRCYPDPDRGNNADYWIDSASLN